MNESQLTRFFLDVDNTTNETIPRQSRSKRHKEA